MIVEDIHAGIGKKKWHYWACHLVKERFDCQCKKG
jgi:hypothetical protein